MSQAATILIVDDDEGHAILTRESLEAAGFRNQIQHVRDGQAALDFFLEPGTEKVRINGEAYLILLDIRMPKLDGIEVLRRLKAHPRLRALPVIMLTTTDDIREVERCHQLGCSVYIQKPVDCQRFSEAIRRLGLFLMLLQVPPVTAG